ncbi:MAG: hypothetical protein H0W72_08295 [Planctomycetes bacterium]|nr:hypothetical protein [Planctomycetota bacterium]
MSRILVALILTVTTAVAADQPLGQIISVDASSVVVGFDASARVAPGMVLAIYGPGRVEKHPLTKEVIVEHPRLLAKAQVIAIQAGTVTARLSARVGEGAIEKGMDVVPMPSDAAPNAPPTVGNLVPVSAAPQSAVRVALPVVAPDGDALSITWSLDGPVGRLGRIGARTTTLPEVTWYTPGAAVSGTITAVVRDPLGHATTVSVPVQVAIADEDLRKRKPMPFQRAAVDRRPARLEREAGGRWWALDVSKTIGVIRYAPGWLTEEGYKGADLPRAPAALAMHEGIVAIVDTTARSLGIFGFDGAKRRIINGFDAPTDVVIDANGVAYVADQGAGGVVMVEPDGRIRGRLGRSGKGPDGFSGLSRLALSGDGSLVCLDSDQRQVMRYDRFQRRLETWEIQGDARDRPADIAVHPRGVLVLLSSGRVLVFNDKGVASESLPALGASGLTQDPETIADSICVDASGEVLVTYPGVGLVMRYAADGKPNGVRGGRLLTNAITSAASDGRMFALNEERDKLLVIDSDGWQVGRIGGLGKEPVAIAAGGDGRWVYVLDQARCNVLRISTSGASDKPLVFASEGKNPGQLSEPTRIAADDAGRCYVLDPDLGRVSVFDSEGKFQFSFGSLGKGAQQFADPRLLAVAPAGDACYVYDYDKFEVKKFALDHASSRANHVGNGGGKGDGPGQIRKLADLGCDRLGLLYVADLGRLDVQVLDFRGNNPVSLHTWTFEALGRAEATAMSVSPDGQFWLVDETGISGTSW